MGTNHFVSSLSVAILVLITVFENVLLVSAVDQAFFNACGAGDVDHISKAIKDNQSLVNAKTQDGESCLHLIAISGSVDATKLILEAGADPNVRSTSFKGLRMHPLSWNVYGGHHEIIELLIKHGVDLNADFDSMFENDEKITAIDLAETLLDSQEQAQSQDLERSRRTYEILEAHGAKKFADLGNDLL